MRKEVSPFYIDGLKEGRAILNSNPSISFEEIHQELRVSYALANRTYLSKNMKDYYKGLYDFWLNQSKKYEISETIKQ